MTTSKWLLVGLLCGFLASTVSCGESKSCDASSCTAGCCNADGECVTNTTAAQCGSNGRQCSACGFAQVCQLGQCYGGTGTGGSGGTTGGGSGTTGGGTGSNPTCTQLGAAETAFYAGNTECTGTFDGGTVTFNASSSAVGGCNAALSNSACSTTDRTKVTSYVSCLQAAPHCTAGNENTAITSFQACAEALLGPSGVSTACAAVLTNPPPTGGGTGVTGGGSGVTGGGSGVTGGGSGVTGGGSGVTGGGSGVTGGGSGVTGGGSGVTGGGSGVTGGGSGVTGGGSGSSNCSDAVSYQAAFFVGRSSCPGGSSGTLLPISNLQSICNNTCTANDQSLLASLGSCASSVPCTSGNETAAVNQYNSCASDVVFSLTTNCRNAILATQTGGGTGTTGGGVGTTGGGTGVTGGGTGATGGGTGTCTEISASALTFIQSNFYSTTLSQIGSTSVPDDMRVEFYATTPGTFNLANAPDDNYSTCDHCLVVQEDNSGTPAQPSATRFYYQQSGSMTFSGTTSTGPITLSLSNVKLVEVTIAGSPSFASTPVPNGQCLHITSANLTSQ